MAANPFDQFDAPAANPFDQFGGGSAPALTPEEQVLGKSTSKAERKLGLVEQVASLPLTAATAITSGPATLAGMWGEAVGGKEKGAAIRNALTFPTYTEAQQRQLQALSGAMESAKLPPTLGGAGIPLNAMVGPATTQGINALGKAAQPVVQAIEKPLAQRAARIQEAKIAKSYENATKIDAAQAAQRIGAALNPAESNPNLRNTLKSVVGGTADIDKRLSEHNVVEITKRVREDLGVPLEKKLDADAIDAALNEASAPYQVVREMPVLNPTDDVVATLDSLKKRSTAINKGRVEKVNALVDDVISEISEGKTGASVLDDIRQLRAEANSVYKQRDKGINPPKDIEIKEADARMAIANAYEQMIDANVTDPKLLDEIRAARVRMAQIYDHARALDYGTNTVDPSTYAKMLNDRKGNMTGLGADIGAVAANYPNVVNASADPLKIAPRITRGGLGATAGALVAGPVGMVIGGAGGYVAGAASAKRMMSPKYQAANAIPKDYRPPANTMTPQNKNALRGQ